MRRSLVVSDGRFHRCHGKEAALVSPSPESRHSLSRYSLLIFIFLLSAKLLNFVKKILIGRLFGVGDTADAFFAASYLPYYLAVFFEGAIFLAFLPAFASIRARLGEAGERDFVKQMFFVFALLGAALIILMNVFSGFIIPQLVPGFKPEKMLLTLPLFRIMTLVLVFISLSTFFQALNSYHRHYVLAASSGFVDTAGMIGVTLISWKLWGITGAAWGSVFGAFLAFLTQMSFYFKKRGLWPPMAFPTGLLKPCLQGLVPLAAVWFFQQAPLLILTRFGSGMWMGTISAMNIAQTLTTVPMGLVSRTVLLSIFPFLVKQAHEDSSQAASATFFSTLRASFVLLIPAGILLSAFAKPIAVIFFSGGGIDAEGTRRIAHSLIGFGWSLFVLYADLFSAQSLIAMRSARSALWITLLRAVLTYSICYYFSSWWDYQGIAFGFSVALVINFFVFFPMCFQISNLRTEWKKLFGLAGQLWLASVPLIAAGIFLNRADVESYLEKSRLSLLGSSLGLILVLGCCYGAALWFMRIPEFKEMMERLTRKRRDAVKS